MKWSKEWNELVITLLFAAIVCIGLIFLIVWEVRMYKECRSDGHKAYECWSYATSRR